MRALKKLVLSNFQLTFQKDLGEYEMKLNYLQSADLPLIDAYVKECINSGQWFLFRSNNDFAFAPYFLKADSNIYALDNEGNILPHSPIQASLEMDELFYFGDMARPASLSNTTLSI